MAMSPTDSQLLPLRAGYATLGKMSKHRREIVSPILNWRPWSLNNGVADRDRHCREHRCHNKTSLQFAMFRGSEIFWMNGEGPQ
jgi:hypothetical protein